jgi:hypothetical protein
MQFQVVGDYTYLPNERNDHLDLRHENAQIRVGRSAIFTHTYLKDSVAVLRLVHLASLFASLWAADPHGCCTASEMLMT